jgi:LGFP repeat
MPNIFNPTQPSHPIHFNPDFPAFAAANPWVGAPTGPIQQLPGNILVQQYQNATAYAPAGDLPYEVHGAIRDKYNQLGGPLSALGCPTTNETGTPDGAGRFNHFQNGSIYYHPAIGAFEVQGAIHALWASLGWEGFGYPITDETGTPDGVGRDNHFRAFLPGGVTADASIYWTPATGAHEVHGAIRLNWQQLGWETSFLGYPVSDEHDVPGGRQNDFQNGSIFWSGPTGTQVLPQNFIVNDSSITFGTGIAVGGYARLEIFSDGTTHYTGHFHASGFPSYDILCVFTVKDANGRAYAASETGHVNGTDSSGSRNHDWDNWGTDPEIRANWPLIRNGGVGGGTASVTSDWSAQKIAEDIAAVVGIVLAIIALPFGGSDSKPKNNTSYNTDPNAPTGASDGQPDPALTA